MPLFIEQNINGNTFCLISKNESPYDLRMQSADMYYSIGISTDAVTAQRKAVWKYLKKPTTVVDRRMIEKPIWSTWARYKADINGATVEAFASEIEKSGFSNSQIEIDDNWEECYGALKFNETKFPNIKTQTDNLRSRGFRVTLWIHPFINKGCEPWYSEASEKRNVFLFIKFNFSTEFLCELYFFSFILIFSYFVTNLNGNSDTQWWNSKTGESAHIDFTKPEAVKWYTDRLTNLQTTAGIDSFKFDAGETSWAPSVKPFDIFFSFYFLTSKEQIQHLKFQFSRVQN